MWKECLSCKKFFEKPYATSYEEWNERRKFCSKKCCYSHRKGNPDFKKKLNLNGLRIGHGWWKGKKRETPPWNQGKRISEPKECKFCLKIYDKRYTSSLKRHRESKFCSPRCARIAKGNSKVEKNC